MTSSPAPDCTSATGLGAHGHSISSNCSKVLRTFPKWLRKPYGPIVFTKKKFKWSPEGVCKTGPCVALQNHGVECRFSWSRRKLYQPFERRALLKNLCFGSFFAMVLRPVRASRFSNVHWKLSMLPNKPRPASIWVSSSGLRPSCISMGTWGTAANHES